jgi:hypothetical protein
MQRGNGLSRSLVLDITSYFRDLDEPFPVKLFKNGKR